MSYEDIIEKLAKNVKEKAELLEKKMEIERHEKEKQLVYLERERQKREAQIKYERDLRERQEYRDQLEYEKTPEGKLQKTEQQRLENLERDKAMGLTKEEIKLKYMNTKERVAYINKKNSEDLDIKISKTPRAKFFSDMGY